MAVACCAECHGGANGDTSPQEAAAAVALAVAVASAAHCGRDGVNIVAVEQLVRVPRRLCCGGVHCRRLVAV